MGDSQTKVVEPARDPRLSDIEVLLATDIFQDLTPAAIGGLLPAVKRHRLERGESFYRVREPSTHLWVLISGQGKMSVPGPAVDLIEPIPYPDLQTLFDEDLPYGIRCYQKAGYTAELTDQVIGVIVDHTSAMPSASSTFDFHHMGGAIARVPDDGTAFGDRRSAFCFNIVGVWDDPAADEPNRQWARAFSSALAPFATGGVYVNFTADPDLVRAAYGEAKYARLRALKRQYDPANLFRLNQNIAP